MLFVVFVFVVEKVISLNCYVFIEFMVFVLDEWFGDL